jgi:hypothetical protein
MRRITTLGLCALAVFAIAAVAAGSALAEPSGEFGFCVAKAGGKYENSGCTKEKAGANKFEWTPVKATEPVSIKAKLKAGTVGTLETVKGTKITCKKSSLTGEIVNAHEIGKVVAAFEECETGKIPCESSGQPEGKIVTAVLAGGTGVEKKGTTPPINNKLAEELHGPGGGAIAEFECAGLTAVAAGSVLHPTKAGKMLTSEIETYAQSKGEQKPSRYEGEAEDSHTIIATLGGGFPEEAGQVVSAEVSFGRAVELNPTL